MLTPNSDAPLAAHWLIGGFSFPKFSQTAGKFPGPNKQPHKGFITGLSAACPGEALPWLRGKKKINPDPVRRLG